MRKLNTMLNSNAITAFNNAAFSSARMADMTEKRDSIHPAMERLYSEAISRGIIRETNRQSQLAKRLDVPSQNVKNWEIRGPSKDALIICQRLYGIDATFIETGTPFSPVDRGGDNIGAPSLSPSETALLNGYRNGDLTTRETMDWLASRALSRREKPKSIADEVLAFDPNSLATTKDIAPENAGPGRTV